MKKSVSVTTFEEAQRVVDVEFPDSDSRIEDCVMEEDFPFSIYGTSDWEISYKRGDLTFKEWEDGE